MLKPVARPRILFIDDDPMLCRGYSLLLGQFGEVISAESVQESKEVLWVRPIDLVLIDLELPDGTGFDVLEFMKTSGHPARKIMLTGHGDPLLLEKALRYELSGFFAKPADPEKLGYVVLKTLRAAGCKVCRQVGPILRDATNLIMKAQKLAG